MSLNSIYSIFKEITSGIFEDSESDSTEGIAYETEEVVQEQDNISVPELTVPDNIQPENTIPTFAVDEEITYESEEAVVKVLYDFARENGFGLITGRSDSEDYKNGNVYERQTLICDCYGSYQSKRKITGKRIRKSSTRKCNCNFHNHGPSLSPSAHPCFRRIDREEFTELIKEQLILGHYPKTILATIARIREQRGETSNLFAGPTRRILSMKVLILGIAPIHILKGLEYLVNICAGRNY